jgi:adenine-specific DNA-methyltransferase
MAKNTLKQKVKKKIETLTHEKASRKNIPTAEFQSVMRIEEQSPIRMAYERRNRDLDPQLVWRGKDEQDWSDLVVPPPLYIQEEVHPKVLIDDLCRQSEANTKATEAQIDLFANFNGLPGGKGCPKAEALLPPRCKTRQHALGTFIQPSTIRLVASHGVCCGVHLT